MGFSTTSSFSSVAAFRAARGQNKLSGKPKLHKKFSKGLLIIQTGTLFVIVFNRSISHRFAGSRRVNRFVNRFCNIPKYGNKFCVKQILKPMSLGLTRAYTREHTVDAKRRLCMQKNKSTNANVHLVRWFHFALVQVVVVEGNQVQLQLVAAGCHRLEVVEHPLPAEVEHPQLVVVEHHPQLVVEHHPQLAVAAAVVVDPARCSVQRPKSGSCMRNILRQLEKNIP